ncbi:MAG: hypothetical protein PVI86_06345 [Phycisphaerae bacterium]|jgi:hypothetical protein
MFQCFLEAYPWDLVGDDLDAVLDQLHGGVGVTGLSLWLGVPPLAEFRVRDRHPRIFNTRGGLFFHPDLARYEKTRLKPVVSDWLDKRRPLERLTDACATRGMSLRAVISASQTGRLLKRHPEMTSKNAFGDQSGMALCLANPDVQSYLGSLLSDLTTHDGLSAVALADFAIHWPDAWSTRIRWPASVGRTEQTLLSICFCESCQQGAAGAGVDIDMARRSVRTRLQKAFDTATSAGDGVESALADDRPLADFAAWRASTLSTLLTRLVESCRCDLLVHRPHRGSGCPASADPDGALPAGVITELDDPDDLDDALCKQARRNEFRLDRNFALTVGAPDLVKLFSRAVELGFAAADVHHYGSLSDAALDPVRQAIRFARRVAD